MRWPENGSYSRSIIHSAGLEGEYPGRGHRRALPSWPAPRSSHRRVGPARRRCFARTARPWRNPSHPPAPGRKHRARVRSSEMRFSSCWLVNSLIGDHLLVRTRQRRFDPVRHRSYAMKKPLRRMRSHSPAACQIRRILAGEARRTLAPVAMSTPSPGITSWSKRVVSCAADTRRKSRFQSFQASRSRGPEAPDGTIDDLGDLLVTQRWLGGE